MAKLHFPGLATTLVLVSIFAAFLPQQVQGARSVDELDSDFVVTEESETEPTVPAEDNDYQVETGDRKHGEVTTPRVTPDRDLVVPNLVSSTVSIPIIRSSGAEGGNKSAVKLEVKPWGCYEYRTGSSQYIEVDDEASGEFYDPEMCMNFCKTKQSWTKYALYMIRGAFCSCFPLNSDFTKNRVEDQLCNLDCEPGNRNSLKCGGNLVVSVYCNTEYSECDQENDDPVNALSTEPEEEDPPLLPKFGCAACKGGDVDVCRLDGIKAEHDYFPANSPLECVRHCRSKLQLQFGTRNERKFYQVAILRWWLNEKELYRPVCMCDESFERYEEAPQEECLWPCPGDSAEICGGPEKYRYSIYCTYPHCEIPEDGEGPPDETLEPGSTSTPQSTSTEESSTFPSSTTLLEPRNSSTESTVSSSGPTSIASTTSDPPLPETPFSPTTTTTEEAPPPPPQVCLVKCKGVDHYGGQWEGCPGEIVRRPCGNGKSGYGRWPCLENGTFAASGPDFSSCKTAWQDVIQDELEEAIQNNVTFSSSEAVKKLGRLETFCTVTNANKVPYFGHEILEISKFVVEIVGLTNGTLREQETVIRQALVVPQLLVMNEGQWKDIANTSERANVATQLFTMIEDTAFALSHDDLPHDYSINFTPRRVNSSDFLITFASGTSIGSQPLQFPSNVEPGTSFITMEAGWGALAADDRPSYVGVSLDPKFIKIQMPANRFTGQSSLTTRNINSNMISLTLAGSSGLNFFGKLSGDEKVRITFQHAVEAWGDKPASIQRKLHPGEIPKMVLGGAVCAYWSTRKLAWDTTGCAVVQSTRTETICECNHLTSFALLMDQHAYVGKDKSLEVITIVLSCLSALALSACIIAFTAIHSIKGARTTITKHLCICLVIGILLLLLFVDRNYFHLPDMVCTAVGIGTHYIYLAAFMWMLIEGLHLYKMVVHVFDSGKSPSTIYKVAAYGAPVLMVGGTCVLGAVLQDHPYRGDLFCWLEGPYIWAFIGPVAVVIVINIIILFVALKTAYQVQPKTAFLRKRRGDCRTWIRGSFSITVILGITWLPGLFMTSPSPIVGKVSAYLFVLLNASQGFLIFVHHCLLNEKVRRAAERSMNLSSWLSRQSSHSKEFTQSGKRSENAIGRQSTTTASVKSINGQGPSPKSNVQRNIAALYSKGHKGSDSSLDSEKRMPETRSRNKGSDSSQRELVYR